MTLPDSEKLRISKEADNTNPVPKRDMNDGLTWQLNSERNQYRDGYVIGANTEASLWYERMGKFAESIGCGTKRLVMTEDEWYWVDNVTGKIYTTPELITEFLNQLNEGK